MGVGLCPRNLIVVGIRRHGVQSRVSQTPSVGQPGSCVYLFTGFTYRGAVSYFGDDLS